MGLVYSEPRPAVSLRIYRLNLDSSMVDLVIVAKRMLRVPENKVGVDLARHLQVHCQSHPIACQ